MEDKLSPDDVSDCKELDEKLWDFLGELSKRYKEELILARLKKIHDCILFEMCDSNIDSWMELQKTSIKNFMVEVLGIKDE